MNTVFVISCEGKALTPTTPCKARKLLKGGAAVKVWSKLNTFGIKLTTKVRDKTPETVLGVDNGTKFEGYSVVCGTENLVNVKWNLPLKRTIVRKMKERREGRKRRRYKLRTRQSRFNNRKRERGWLAPSQKVVHLSRIKIISEICKIYPVNQVAIEDVKFNHSKFRWGKNFSTIEISKQNLRNWFYSKGIKITEYSGIETKRLRDRFGLVKTYSKSEDVFTSHCSDSLAIVCGTLGYGVTVGKFMVFDDTYRYIRRKLYYSQFNKLGMKKKYSKGTVKTLRKGLKIGTNNNKAGVLCGVHGKYFSFKNIKNKISGTVKIKWISSQFNNIKYT